MIVERQDHPIERIMDNAFLKMRNLVDADTVVGDPVITADGVSIIPVSKITMGFLTGGGEYSEKDKAFDYPFAGASGAGVSVTPVCFLVSDGNSVKLINVGHKNPFDKVLETLPELAGKIFTKKGK